MSLDILAQTSLSSHFGGFDELQEENNKTFRCNDKQCRREFTSKRNLVDHTRGHHSGTKPHTCTYPKCGKSFLRPAHLLIHTRIHTGEKPFVCEYPGCGKRWNQKSALKQHLRSHTGEKPFSCTAEGCGKKFSTSSSCKRHILTHAKSSSDVELVPVSHKRKISIDAWDEHPTQKKFATLSITENKEEISIPLQQSYIRMNVSFILN